MCLPDRTSLIYALGCLALFFPSHYSISADKAGTSKAVAAGVAANSFLLFT